VVQDGCGKGCDAVGCSMNPGVAGGCMSSREPVGVGGEETEMG
jgi:hypothetical protein